MQFSNANDSFFVVISFSKRRQKKNCNFWIYFSVFNFNMSSQRCRLGQVNLLPNLLNKVRARRFADVKLSHTLCLLLQDSIFGMCFYSRPVSNQFRRKFFVTQKAKTTTNAIYKNPTIKFIIKMCTFFLQFIPTLLVKQQHKSSLNW